MLQQQHASEPKEVSQDFLISRGFDSDFISFGLSTVDGGGVFLSSLRNSEVNCGLILLHLSTFSSLSLAKSLDSLSLIWGNLLGFNGYSLPPRALANIHASASSKL